MLRDSALAGAKGSGTKPSSPPGFRVRRSTSRRRRSGGRSQREAGRKRPSAGVLRPLVEPARLQRTGAMQAGTEVKPPQRPSILLRPKTKASRNNIETADAQWEHEQQRLAAARRRREEQDAERMRWHGSARGDPGDKALVQCARAASPALYAPCILQPCALHCRARCTAVHAALLCMPGTLHTRPSCNHASCAGRRCRATCACRRRRGTRRCSARSS